MIFKIFTFSSSCACHVKDEKIHRVDWTNSDQLLSNHTQSSALDSEFVEPPVWNIPNMPDGSWKLTSASSSLSYVRA